MPSFFYYWRPQHLQINMLIAKLKFHKIAFLARVGLLSFSQNRAISCLSPRLHPPH